MSIKLPEIEGNWIKPEGKYRIGILPGNRIIEVYYPERRGQQFYCRTHENVQAYLDQAHAVATAEDKQAAADWFLADAQKSAGLWKLLEPIIRECDGYLDILRKSASESATSPVPMTSSSIRPSSIDC
jgi:hypothetical protein